MYLTIILTTPSPKSGRYILRVGSPSFKEKDDLRMCVIKAMKTLIKLNVMVQSNCTVPPKQAIRLQRL